MKKIKYLMAAVAFTFILGISSVYAQDQSTQSTTTTSNTSSSNSAPADTDNWMNNPTALIIGGLAVLVLGAVIVMMVRNRRKTIGGMQNQDKAAPRQVTTQSINNPGSGV